MKLNEMRVMREENYVKFRELISGNLADPVLEVIRENQKALGLDPDVFDLIYEGFWDLYCMRPKCDGITSKMVQVWNNRFILQINPDDPEIAIEDKEEAKAEDGAEVASGDGKAEVASAEDVVSEKQPEVKMADVQAIVRIRIPKMAPEPELDEDGNPIEIDPDTIDWSKAEEVPPEDKAFSMAVSIGGQKIWQLNQLAQRVFRKDLANELKNVVEQLESLDMELFHIKLE